MDLHPPDGSKISILESGSEPTIVIPHPSRPTRYILGVFLLCWLGGWAMGFESVISILASGRGNAFLVFWLGAWTIGGIFAVFTLYRAFRPTVPETLVLGRGSIGYDSGVTAVEFNLGRRTTKSFQDHWAAMFPRRHRLELSSKHLQSLRLRETVLSNRLTVDVGADRIDLAADASEIEREWLAGLLTRRYKLPDVVAGPADR